MNIQNISKNDREVTVTLSSDELVKLCNVLYYARDKYDGDNLYHEIKSDLMIARDISQYGNIDDTTLSKIIKERAKAANPYLPGTFRQWICRQRIQGTSGRVRG